MCGRLSSHSVVLWEPKSKRRMRDIHRKRRGDVEEFDENKSWRERDGNTIMRKGKSKVAVSSALIDLLDKTFDCQVQDTVLSVATQRQTEAAIKKTHTYTYRITQQ